MNQSLFDRLRLREGKTYSELVVHSALWGGTSVLYGQFDIEYASVVDGTSFASNDDVMRALFEAWKLGWSPELLDEVPGLLATVSVSDLEAALRTCRASAVVSVTAAVAMH